MRHSHSRGLDADAHKPASSESCIVNAGNFLLLNDHELSPLKAIDFGLATPFNPDQLPRSDLGLEGTPW